MTPDELLQPQWRVDPYPLYTALRTAGPLHRAERLESWVLTRHADVVAALRNPRLSSNRGPASFTDVQPALSGAVRSFKQSLKSWALFRDPPEHTRIRGLQVKAFVPSLVEAMRPKIRAVVDDLLAVPTERGELEVVGELADPLPAAVIAEILGVPPGDRARFKSFSQVLATLLAPGLKTPEMLAHAVERWQEMELYLTDLLAERRSAPRDDLLSRLLTAEHQDGLLSEQEVRATVGLLLFAGHETTTNLLTNSVLLLARHREAQAVLRSDSSLLPTAVEEVLRYEPPVQLLTRCVGEDLILCGQPLRRGERVMLLLASANRDPDQFPDPERFLVTRRDNRHVSFGMGIHFCLGAALARIETQIALERLLARWPDIRQSEDLVVWRDNLAFRCPQSLRVRHGQADWAPA